MPLHRTIPLLLILLAACDAEPRTVVRRDRHGRPRAEVDLVHATRHGPVRLLDTAGRVVMEGAYRNDLRSGTWKEWSHDGTLRGEREYRRGRLDGTVHRWHANGTPAAEEPFEDGRLNGTLRRWFPNGRPRVVMTYVDGEAEGPWVYWERWGVDTLRFEGQAHRGLRHGVWTTYQGDTLIRKQGPFHKGEKQGTWVEFDRNGLSLGERTFHRGRAVHEPSVDE